MSNLKALSISEIREGMFIYNDEPRFPLAHRFLKNPPYIAVIYEVLKKDNELVTIKNTKNGRVYYCYCTSKGKWVKNNFSPYLNKD
jgi:hypothetical protein